jgi:hypothetical protein
MRLPRCFAAQHASAHGSGDVNGAWTSRSAPIALIRRSMSTPDRLRPDRTSVKTGTAIRSAPSKRSLSSSVADEQVSIDCQRTDPAAIKQEVVPGTAGHSDQVSARRCSSEVPGGVGTFADEFVAQPFEASTLRNSELGIISRELIDVG